MRGAVHEGYLDSALMHDLRARLQSRAQLRRQPGELQSVQSPEMLAKVRLSGRLAEASEGRSRKSRPKRKFGNVRTASTATNASQSTNTASLDGFKKAYSASMDAKEYSVR